MYGAVVHSQPQEETERAFNQAPDGFVEVAMMRAQDMSS